MAENKIFDTDSDFKQEFNDRSLKIQKLVRDGMQITYNVSLNDIESQEDVFHILPDLEKINERAQKADKYFGEIMVQTMENKQFPQTLHKLLQKQKIEAETILKDYDNIILLLNSTLSTQDKEYREKIEKQSIQHQLIRQRIEEVISELNRVGKEEISSMRAAIIDHSKHVSQNLLKENKNVHGETVANKSLDSFLWKISTEMLTTEQMEDAFLIPHNDTFLLRRKLLSEICKLRNELEREKLNYNLKKQVFEQEIFFLSEKHRIGLSKLSGMRRKCIVLRDKKNSLNNELKNINSLIEREKNIKDKQITQFQQSELEMRYARDENSTKYLKVFSERKSDVLKLHSEVSTSLEYIFRNVLNRPWAVPNVISPQKHWENYLDTILEDSIIDTILRMMEEFWMEWKIYDGLSEQHEALVTLTAKYNNILKMYTKYQHK